LAAYLTGLGADAHLVVVVGEQTVRYDLTPKRRKG